MARTQISDKAGDDTFARAQDHAERLGLSFSEYLRRTVSEDMRRATETPVEELKRLKGEREELRKRLTDLDDEISFCEYSVEKFVKRVSEVNEDNIGFDSKSLLLMREYHLDKVGLLKLISSCKEEEVEEGEETHDTQELIKAPKSTPSSSSSSSSSSSLSSPSPNTHAVLDFEERLRRSKEIVSAHLTRRR